MRRTLFGVLWFSQNNLTRSNQLFFFIYLFARFIASVCSRRIWQTRSSVYLSSIMCHPCWRGSRLNHSDLVSLWVFAPDSSRRFLFLPIKALQRKGIYNLQTRPLPLSAYSDWLPPDVLPLDHRASPQTSCFLQYLAAKYQKKKKKKEKPICLLFFPGSKRQRFGYSCMTSKYSKKVPMPSLLVQSHSVTTHPPMRARLRWLRQSTVVS